MSEIRTIPPALTKNEWNALLDHALEKEANYIIRQVGTETQAINGSTGKIDYKGTDAKTVIQAAHDALPSEVRSYVIHFKNGLYSITAPINVTKPVQFVGAGIDTILQLANGANCRMFNFTMPGAVFHNCGLQNLKLDGNQDNQTDGDYLIYLQDVYDPIIHLCWIYKAYKGGIYLTNVEKPIIIKNWIEVCTKFGQTGYALEFAGTTTFPRCCLNVFYSNYWDMKIGNDVERAIVEGNSFTAAAVGNVDLCGTLISMQHNLFRNPIAVDDLWSCIKIFGTATKSAAKILICNNLGNAAFPYRPSRFVYVDNYSEDVLIKNNIFKDFGTAFIFTHASAVNVITKRNIGYVTENSGTATFSGNGTQTQFTIAHGLASTPKTAIVTAGSNDAKGDFYVTYTGTNILVTYATAPPTGTNNVVLRWSAEM